ncbi:MAG: Hsp70 family protein [Pirellulaceae bacterium]
MPIKSPIVPSDSLGVAYPRPLHGQEWPPEALEAWVLDKLRRDASRTVGNFRHAVITVPAYFDEVRRKATQDAGYMAGLDVLDIINEPTAAAVAFGMAEGFLDERGEAKRPINILVYDLGGGTFDVTVMRLEGGHFQTLSTDGDFQLGGKDWDQRLVDFVAAEFMKRYQVDPRDDLSAAARIWRECEEAKRTLSLRGKATIAADYQGNWIRLEITRAEFESMTRDLLERTTFTCREAISAAGLSWDDVDRVLLVGGSTRMPQVKEMLAELSGRAPDDSISPDEAVAHGAAIRAGAILAAHAGRPPRLKIRNVNSHSLGVVGKDPKTLRRTGILIPRDTPLPASATRTFRTQKADQRSILLQIVEGENPDPIYNSQVGRCTVPNLPKGLPAGQPILVSFEYEENGRLSVHVRVEGTDVELAHELNRENSLAQADLDRYRKQISGLPPQVIALATPI